MVAVKSSAIIDGIGNPSSSSKIIWAASCSCLSLEQFSDSHWFDLLLGLTA